MSQELKLELEKDLLDLCVYTFGAKILFPMKMDGCLRFYITKVFIEFLLFISKSIYILLPHSKNHKRYLIEIVPCIFGS